MKTKGEAICFRAKLQKQICFNDKNVLLFPEKYRYLEWTKRRDDNGKECVMRSITQRQ